MSVASSPLQQDERLIPLDVIRGVALFGILLMNITSFGMPYAYSDPTVYGGATGADLWAWITTSMLFEGTQRGLFSILFGAGVILLTERIDARGGDASDVFFRRNLWLIVFGIVHGFLLLWTGEILFAYGATAPFVYPFRKATPRTLVAFALGGLLFGAAWNQVDAYNGITKHTAFQEAQAAKSAGATLARAQEKALKAWPEIVDEMKPSAEKIKDKLDAMRGSYASVVVHQAPLRFGLYGHLGRHQLYYVVFAIWAAQLVISPIWLAYYRFGPLEWLWRTLTYGVKQPMRREARSGDGDPLVATAG